jgi:thiol-disulfide isomerase/thioredoxin
MSASVELISAPWCKACIRVKPEIAETCKTIGSSLTIINYDDLDEEQQSSIKHLPLIRLTKQDGSVSEYHVDTLNEWKEAMINSVQLKLTEDF